MNTADAHATEIWCAWCGMSTRPGGACQACGSPLKRHIACRLCQGLSPDPICQACQESLSTMSSLSRPTHAEVAAELEDALEGIDLTQPTIHTVVVRSRRNAGSRD